MPPIAPTATASELVVLPAKCCWIRAGMVVTMLGATMAMPLGATVAYLISRIEGFFGPLSILQVMGAVGMAILTFYHRLVVDLDLSTRTLGRTDTHPQ